MINRRHLFRFALLTAAALLTGCSAEILDGHGGQVPICLTASVQQDKGMTRAGTGIQSAQFGQNETFYAYFPNGARIGSKTSACNTTFTTTNTEGATSPATQPYFNADVSSADVYAYYPQTVKEAANQKFSVALDQSGDEGYKASDLMYATTTVTKSGQTSMGNLTFSHKMSKIIVSATAGAGITAIRQVRIVGGNKSITIVNPMTTDENTNPFFGSTPSLSDAITTADNGCVKLYNHATGEATVSCAGLIPPQTIASGTAFLEVVTDVGTATYSLASAKTFAPGESYAYSISLTLASIGITTAINDWTAAGDPIPLANDGTATLLYGCPGTALASADVGMIICEHGKAHTATTGALTCGGKKVAIIAYKGSAGSADKSTGSTGYVGLAIALKDYEEGDTKIWQWYTANEGKCITNGQSDNISTAIGTSGDFGKGIDNTNRLADANCGSGHVHAAAQKAKAYKYDDSVSAGAHPTGTSQWFLPTMYQWNLMVKAMCGGSTDLTTSTNNSYKAASFNTKITAAGGTGVQADAYWSSVEYNAGGAWYVYFNGGSAGHNYKGDAYYVRPVLAF